MMNEGDIAKVLLIAFAILYAIVILPYSLSLVP